MISSGVLLMAVYQPASDLLQRQIESIRNQSLRDWVCLVGIDGTDASAAGLVSEVVGGDPRFLVHEFEDNVGHYLNFARLAELAAKRRPAWVAFADQDDEWYSDKLEKLLLVLEGGAFGVTGQARVVRDGQPVGVTSRRSVPVGALLCDNQVTGSSTLFRGDVLLAGCPLPEPRKSSYHDHWFGVLSAALGRHEFVDDVVQDYVQHDANVLGEELGTRLRARFAQFLGSGQGFRTLVDERWGWRVAMACVATERIPGAAADPAVAAFARGRMTVRLALFIVRAVLRSEVAPLRGFALIVGGTLSRTVGLRKGSRR